MNIIVCVKQVPDTAEIKIDPVTNTLIRAGVPSIVNPFDAYALETAVRLKEKCGGKVTVISMGPEQAKAALKQCLSVGADEAYLISDRNFGGSDTLATSYILAAAVRYLEKTEKIDLIMCGKQAIDGDTGQVGPEIAEHLGWAQMTYAKSAEPDKQCLEVKRESEQGYDIYDVSLPAVVTMTKPDYEPRFASIKSKLAANRAEIKILTGLELETDISRCGLKGSPTKVKKTFTPKKVKSGLKIEKEAPEAVAELLVKLQEEHLI